MRLMPSIAILHAAFAARLELRLLSFVALAGARLRAAPTIADIPAKLASMRDE